jgi:hypothetical protein
VARVPTLRNAGEAWLNIQSKARFNLACAARITTKPCSISRFQDMVGMLPSESC